MRFKNRCARHAKHSRKPFNYAEDGRLLTGVDIHNKFLPRQADK